MKPIQETVGLLLFQVCNVYRNRTDAALNTPGFHGGQERVLLSLWAEDGQTLSGLAEQLGVERPALTGMLDRMEEADLVEQRRDPSDSRPRVYLTDQGWDLRELVERCWEEIEKRAFAGFTPEEQPLFRRLLLRMRSNLT